MLEIIGWTGSFLLIIHALPQIYATMKTKCVYGVSLTFYLTWFFGCLCMLIYEGFTDCKLPFIFDYVFNVLISGVLIVLYFKHK